MKRRGFIKKLFFSIVGLGSLFALDAFWFEKYIIDWTVFDISKNKKNRITLIQLSDIHLKELNSSLISIVEKVNNIRPDVILFTGDTITRKSKLPMLNELLALFDQSILKILIYGNKEHSGKILYEEIAPVLNKHNGVVLVNKNHIFTKGTRSINIVGIDDFVGGTADFQKAANDMDNKQLDTIVLNHCPEYSDTISELNSSQKVNITCILSGHTHGGQITFFGKELFKPVGSGIYLKGWYTTNNIRMYVSKGIGTTLLPVRFGARAEASIFYV
ncbi:metallophosphoesterase [Maribacter sp. MMG018]|uniref:metallophosphoesterase n=1 Tax=Maribacter sp. MMG018 TaxID=2822688 RepID=UPI001B378955|nr:metallophosphoesterase [Maribacter sp. MMG018]MBQ4914852.1 metallophosphoesterase [Maribacter sp. MMG018]